MICDKIARLMASGFIMEVLHPDWLANPVLAEKKRIYEVAAMAKSAQLEIPSLPQQQSGLAFQVARESKKVKIDETNSDHTVIIGVGLEDK